MAFDSKKFQEELLAGVTLTDAQKEALGAVLSNPSVVGRLEESGMRQSDYSRQVAEAQRLKQDALDYKARLESWQVTENARLEAERLAIPNRSVDPTGSTNYLTADKFNEEITKVQSGAIGFLSTLNDKSMEHFQEFGKRLDTAAVLKKAQEDGTNFVIAYERFIQPAREEKAKAELEVRIKRERDEAVKEALANASLPGATTPQPLAGGQSHVLDMIKDAPQGKFGWKAAADAHTRDIYAGTVQHE